MITRSLKYYAIQTTIKICFSLNQPLAFLFKENKTIKQSCKYNIINGNRRNRIHEKLKTFFYKI